MATASKPPATGICPKHNNKYTAYCQQHNVSMCIDCLLEDHKQCITGTINVSSAVETAMSTSEEYLTSLEMLGAEFHMKMEEKKKSLRRLECVDKTLKDGIRSFRIKLIAKINTISGEALELSTCVLAEQRLLAETDINRLGKLMTQLKVLQKTVEGSFNSRLSSMMEGLSNTNQRISRLETEYERIKKDIGNIRVQFIINPMITDFLENFNSLGEMGVKNEKGERKSTCLDISPTDTKRISRLYRRSMVESDDASKSMENDDEVFVYPEHPLAHDIIDPYSFINADDESLFTDTTRESKHCSAPPPVPSLIPERSVAHIREKPQPGTATNGDLKITHDRSSEHGSQLKNVHTDTRTQMNRQDVYAPSIFYEQQTSGGRNVNNTPYAINKSVSQNAKSIANDYKIPTSSNIQSLGKTEECDHNEVVLRPKRIPRRRRSDDVQSVEKAAPSDTTPRTPIPTIPKLKSKTLRDRKATDNTVHDIGLLNPSSNPWLSDSDAGAPRPHVFSGRSTNVSGNTTTDSGVIIVESRDMSEYRSNSVNASPNVSRIEAPINFMDIKSSQERLSDSNINSIRNGGMNNTDTRTSFTNISNPETSEPMNVMMPRLVGKSKSTGRPKYYDTEANSKKETMKLDGTTKAVRPPSAAKFGTVETRIRLFESRDKQVESDRNHEPRNTDRDGNESVHTHAQTWQPITGNESKTIEQTRDSNNGKTGLRNSGFRVPVDKVIGNACLVTGIAVTTTGDVILCLCNQDELQLYDSNGEQKHVHKITKPYGACAMWGNRIATTLREPNSICIFQVEDNTLKCLQEQRVFVSRDLFGIDYSNGFFSVSSLDKVLIMTESPLQLYGTVKGTASTRGLLRWRQKKTCTLLFSNVHYSAIQWSAQALLIYVSDYREERVACIDITGHVKWTHFVSCPTSIQLHKEKVFVATKKRIVVLCARTGRCIRDITDGVPKRPWALVVDTMTNGLLVSNRSRSAIRAKQICHVPFDSDVEQSQNDQQFDV